MGLFNIITYSILFIIVIGIIYKIASILIDTLFTVSEIEKPTEVVEGLLSMDDFTKPFKDIGGGIKKVADSAGDQFKKLGEIFDKIKNGFNDMTNKFSEIDRIGNKIKGKFISFGDGWKDAFEGINQTFLGLGAGLSRGFGDITKLIKYSGIYVITYLECGIKFVGNIFTYCILFYLLDTCFAIWYAFYRFIFYCCYKSGLNVYPIVDGIWKFIEMVDDLIYNKFSASPMKYTAKVRFDCYTCRRLKTNALKRIASDVETSFNVKMPEDLNRGVSKFSSSKRNFLDSFRW